MKTVIEAGEAKKGPILSYRALVYAGNNLTSHSFTGRWRATYKMAQADARDYLREAS